jgi:hypothetical protein
MDVSPTDGFVLTIGWCSTAQVVCVIHHVCRRVLVFYQQCEIVEEHGFTVTVDLPAVHLERRLDSPLANLCCPRLPMMPLMPQLLPKGQLREEKRTP